MPCCRTARRAVALLCLLAGCSPSVTPQPAPLACAAGTPMVREEVFFGRGLPDHTEVSDSAWAQFLADEVTPRFPQGITVLEARGQWRGRDGKIVRERTWVLVLYHEPSPAEAQAVTELAQAYAQRFAQEAVLRDRTATCVTFR